MRLKRITGNIGVRLTFWYAAAFLFACGALFALAYASFSSSLEKEDRAILDEKYRIYSAAYEENDIAGLEEIINSEKEVGKPSLYFVRLAQPPDTTLFLSLPDKWPDSVDLEAIRNIPGVKGYHILQADLPDGAIFEVGSFPLDDGSILQIGKDVRRREELLAQFREVFYIIMIPAFLLSVFGGYFLTRRALRPMRDLASAIQSISETGNLQTRVPVGDGRDELKNLARLFNMMQDRIERLVKGMRDSIDHIAHDLRTPMTRLRVSAEIALQPDKDINCCREALSDCLEESERILRTLNALMSIAEAEAGVINIRKEDTDLVDIIIKTVDIYRHVAEEKGVALDVKTPINLLAQTDPQLLQQSLANIIDNAIKYTPSGGNVEVEAVEESGCALLIVRDTGAGVAEADLPNIWDRLYRADKSRSERGLGLGLSIVKSFIGAIGGAVSAQSEPGKGSVFTIKIPLRDSGIA